MTKNLKTTLDRWFSLYIRLRDSDANGYSRCISCGKPVYWKEADCGHFINRRHMNTRYDERNCNLQCRNCLTLDALILMDDLRWKPLSDVKVGDTVLGFEEFIYRKSSRRFILTKVIHAEVVVKDVYEVELANGDKIKTTANHKWLARRGGSTAYQWLETQHLWVDSYNLKGNNISGPFREHVFSTVCKPFRVIEQICNEECGWLAGMIDADGHITQQIAVDKRRPDRNTYGLRVGISQIEGAIAQRAKELLEKYSENRATCRQDIRDHTIYTKDGKEYRGKAPVCSYLITGTNVEKLEFLQRVRPMKLARLDLNKIGKIRSKYDTTVKSITYVGKMEVMDLETESHTYIANGYAMHNCNRFDEGNNTGYMQGLVKKYGEGVINELHFKKSLYRKFSEFEFKELIKHYKREVKKLQAEKNDR